MRLVTHPIRIAFFAPLKPPGHPVPSGDREMARNLIKMMSRDGRAVVDLASDLQTRDGAGNIAHQEALRKQAQAEADRLVHELPQDTALWVTYHNYYKAPDLIGPVVAKRRGLPYVIVEASRAKKRLTGPWAGFARAAEAASDAADVIFYPIQHDRQTLERDRFGAQVLCNLPPFLPLADLPAARPPRPGHWLSVGMMREGDKLASYALIAETLHCLDRADWRLDIAGDGPAADKVRALMAPFGERVRFLGQLSRQDLADVYAKADVFLWPGVNEAYGMVYLEAQAAGVPVVAQDRPGVRDVQAEPHPSVEAGPQAMAARLVEFLDNPTARARSGDLARDRIAEHHLLPTAADRFWAGIAPLLQVSA